MLSNVIIFFQFLNQIVESNNEYVLLRNDDDDSGSDDLLSVYRERDLSSFSFLHLEKIGYSFNYS